MPNFCVLRYGINPVNQPDASIVAVALIESETRDAEIIARSKYLCFSDQLLELRPVSRCRKALVREATEAERLHREADELMTEVLP